jgi:hypothetical protein
MSKLTHNQKALLSAMRRADVDHLLVTWANTKYFMHKDGEQSFCPNLSDKTIQAVVEKGLLVSEECRTKDKRVYHRYRLPGKLAVGDSNALVRTSAK